MTAEQLAALCESYGQDMLKMDGFDDCIVGVVCRFGSEPILCYDYEKVILKLMGQGASREEAMEFHEFNQAGAWVGPKTPAFLRKERGE